MSKSTESERMDKREPTLGFDGEFLRRGFTAVPNSLLEETSISLGARMTLICLMKFAWKAKPFPGQETLSKMLGVSDRTVREYLAELTAEGFISATRRGRGRTNLYTIHEERILQSAEDSSVHLFDAGTLDRKQASGLDRKPASGPKEEDEVEEDEVVSALSTDVVVRGSLLPDKPPPPVLVNGRNLPHDTLAEVCHVSPNSPRQREVAVALNGRSGTLGIRRLLWQETFDAGGAAPEEWETYVEAKIKERAGLWPRVFAKATMTPLALAKWWCDLPDLAQRTNGSALDALQVAELEIAKLRS